ncbi:putative polysaccharide polymerase [Indibacter alkaliphilus LW1]|uniref:Polysaccharide polymerase n=1 Tax=Indibacter alkaliphilus (strain CCUG 57479 / KCTC 22604 / LW1) TaxID=1189612 RepID=S2D8Y1_INDAL|nr:O-antigen ligase family protein [Indibacter alkaliphilus]EOZ95677.1 putative polysaccharide polymerase [Indibacter alkaliphilus LW1]
MLQLDLNKIEIKVFTWVVFITLSLPSIKLIYSSPLLNAALIGIFAFFMLHFYTVSPVKLSKVQKVFLTLFLSFISFIFISYFIFPYSHYSLDKYVKYFFVFIAVIVTATFVEKVDIRLLVNLLIAWGIVLCIWKLTIGIRLNFDKGQTYLTYGMPIGCSLMLLLTQVFKKLSWKEVVFYGGLILLNIFVILTSRGRSSIIFPFLTFGIVIITALFFGNNKKPAVKVMVFGTILLLIVGSYVLANLESFKSLARVIALVESGGEDDRLNLWVPAIEQILINPFGHGTDAYHYLLIHYPHNIILEITLSFGIVGLLLLMGMLAVFGNRFVKNLDKNFHYVAVSAVGIYFFLSWNTSHDLATSTIPFVGLSLSLKQ